MNISGINVLDVVLILLIIAAGIIGLKRGFFKELVMTVGYILVFVISFILKNPLAEWLSLNLPFFKFAGPFRGMTVLNIVIYQVIAFLVIFAIIMIIFNLVLIFTNLLEKILSATIILGVVSKILGFFLGLINGLILVFVLSLFLSIPSINRDVIAESKVKKAILVGTPGLNRMARGLVRTFEDLDELSYEYRHNDNKDELNKKSIQVMINNKIIEREYVQKLVNASKLDPDVLE